MTSEAASQTSEARQSTRRGRARRAGLLTLGVVALVAAAGGVWWAWFRTPPLVGFASGNGRIEATEIDIATELPGRVVAVLVDEGEPVEFGQVLARIDVESAEAQLAEANASLLATVEAHQAAGAEFNRRDSLYRLAQREYARTRRLFEAGVAPKDDLDRRHTEVETSKAALELATRQVKQAEREIEAAAARMHRLRVNIDDGTLVAPVAGRVLYRLAEPGEVLPVGGKILTLVERDDAYMTLFLSEREAAQVRIGADARIRLDGFPDRSWPGDVSYVSPKAQFTPKQVETASQREKLVFKIKVQLPRPVDPIVKPGMRGVAIVRLDPDAPWPERIP